MPKTFMASRKLNRRDLRDTISLNIISTKIMIIRAVMPRFMRILPFMGLSFTSKTKTPMLSGPRVVFLMTMVKRRAVNRQKLL